MKILKRWSVESLADGLNVAWAVVSPNGERLDDHWYSNYDEALEAAFSYEEEDYEDEDYDRDVDADKKDFIDPIMDELAQVQIGLRSRGLQLDLADVRTVLEKYL